MPNWYDKKTDPAKIIAETQAKKGITKREAEAIVRKQVPLEKDYQKKIKEAIQKEYPKALVVKIAQGEYSQAGIPDLMVIIDGHFFGFEIKRPYFHKKPKEHFRNKPLNGYGELEERRRLYHIRRKPSQL